MAQPLAERRRPRIGILAHAGRGNLGDEALVAAVIQVVRRRVPYAEVVAFTANPADTEPRHGIPTFPIQQRALGPLVSTAAPEADVRRTRARIKRLAARIPPLYALLRWGARQGGRLRRFLAELMFLGRSARRLRGTDLLLVAGSQQLNDHFGGTWGFPYTLFKWNVMAKLLGTKVAFLSVGAGPIRRPLSKFFLRRSLAAASYRSYRDRTSAQLVESLGVPGGSVVPDLVHALELAPASPATGERGPLVGINPLPYYDDRYWPESDRERYGGYVAALAEFACWLLSHGYRVAFFPTQFRADPPVIADIRRKMEELGWPGDGVQELSADSLDSLLSLLTRMDVVVATRYHGMMLGYLFGKPTIGIAYHGKSVDLMAAAGLGDYVLHADGVQSRKLIECFRRLETNWEALAPEIRRRVEAHRVALERQFDQVLALL